MIQYKVVYAQGAFKDLANIYNYILNNSLEPSIAGNLVKKIQHAIDSLNYFPFRHPKFGSFIKPNEDVRVFIIKDHNIIYQINDKNRIVKVLEIASCRRDYKNSENTN